MRSTQIRSTFLDYFTSRGHRHLPSSSLIPDSPTLLLSNAGMNQFVPIFTGEVEPGQPRATTVQKCARTGDLDEVGRTTRHSTFFEMLGSFSFGDYFKQGAVEYAWELFTDPVGGFGLDPERIWVTVYTDDDESVRLWRRVGFPESRIQRLGMADNYWSMGVPGPAGPSSELHYDRGPAFGPEGGPAVNGERYVELWNLVFMQTRRGEGGEKTDYPILGPLPRRHIDTGLGLDRLAMILQDVHNVNLTDLMRPTLRVVEELSGRGYPTRLGPVEFDETKTGLQIVADHARTVAYLIADGVLPTTDGRGYVLRRLMRRAIRQGRMLGIDGPMLPAVTASVVETLGTAWPELVQQADAIRQITTAEEESFGRTLSNGTRLLNAAIARTRAGGNDNGTLSGDTAFELHGTYGFPVELTVEAAREAGLGVDTERFTALLGEQQRRAKADGRAHTAQALRRGEVYRELHTRHGATEFLGYQQTEADGTVLGLLVGGEEVDAVETGQVAELALDRTPFYARSGGQVGDIGTLRGVNGAVVEITDTVFGLDGFRVHSGRVLEGTLRTGETVRAQVDAARRRALARSHSATHILHSVVRQVLGEHARQHGSLVEPDRLRFDFMHFSAVTPDQLAEIEERVNGLLLDDPEVRAWYAGRAEAEEAGALALFGEKYGETVRIVDIGEFSRELCGGTHVGHGSQVGSFRLLSESSIGSNLRRVEALTGGAALRRGTEERRTLRELCGLLDTRPTVEAVTALEARLGELRTAERTLADLRRAELSRKARELAGRHRVVGGGGLVVVERVDGIEAGELRPLVAEVVGLLPQDGPGGQAGQDGVVVLGTEHGGKGLLVAGVTRSLLAGGVQARQVLGEAAELVGGGAGGQGGLANAGGRRPEGLAAALEAAERAAGDVLGSVGVVAG